MTNLKPENKERFYKLFNYEVQNRAMALIGIKKLSVRLKGTPEGVFWEEYYKLELLNQERFLPITRKYNITLQPELSSKLMAKVWGVFSSIAPKSALKSISDATNDYVSDLEEMALIAPQEDKEFFKYVVEQEIAQAEGMVHLVNGDPQSAAERIRRFLAEQTQYDQDAATM